VLLQCCRIVVVELTLWCYSVALFLHACACVLPRGERVGHAVCPHADPITHTNGVKTQANEASINHTYEQCWMMMIVR
jgi:hypothetical protein